ncbi:MAG: DUF2284 domain-containing protein [Clostridiales bacterium]|nr:DUF2284 domain-containing protein [Candidatus Blautia equi]
MNHESLAEKLIAMAQEEGFSEAAVISTGEFYFVPEYRSYCEDNLCGNYGKNYACPPYCGTVDEMHARTDNYRYALVLKSDHQVNNAMDPVETKALKKFHNTLTRQLTKRLNDEGLIEDGLSIMAGPCNLCAVCGMPEGRPCPFEAKRFSCLSAYCIDVVHLAKSAGMPLAWDMDKVSFFSMYLFS